MRTIVYYLWLSFIFTIIFNSKALSQTSTIDYYWVEDGGSWDDVNHWAKTSGGTEKHLTPPNHTNNVYFDDKSFTKENQIVSVSDLGTTEGFFVKNMDWSLVTNNPTFQIKKTLPETKWISNYLSGSLLFSENMKLDFLGAEFLFNGSDYFVDTKGKDLGKDSWIALSWDYKSGSTSNSICNIMSDLITGKGILFGCQKENNTFNSNGYTIKNESGYFWTYGNGANNLINLSNSKIITPILTTNTPILGDNYILELIGNELNESKISGNGHFLNNLRIKGSSTISYNDITIKKLVIEEGSSLYIKGGTTIAADTLIAKGSETKNINILSDVEGIIANISVATGKVFTEWLQIKDNNAIGGATFYAANSIDLGNNSGWNFISTENYYWVGNSGIWSDVSHWAKTSGGNVKHASPPTLFNNVFFDENSFTIPNQIVEVPDLGTWQGFFVKTMDWSNVTNTPTFKIKKSKPDILWIGNYLEGSLLFSENMNLDFFGAEFLFTGDDYIVDTKGKDLGVDSWVSLGFGYNNGYASNSTCNIMSDIISDNGIYFGCINDNNTYKTNGHKILINKGYFWTRGFNGINNIVDISNSLIRVPNFTTNSPVSGTNYQIEITGNELNESRISLNGHQIENATITESVSTIRSNSTIKNLKIDPGTTLKIFDQVILTSESIDINGIQEKVITIQSDSVGKIGTLSIASGEVVADWLVLRDNIATGGANFQAKHSLDSGNVTGWNFICMENLESEIIIDKEITCQDGLDGQIIVKGTGGITGIYSYELLGSSVSNNTGLFNGLSSGDYTFKVTDGFGCSSTSEISLINPSDPIWYEDADSDGFGNANVSMTSCEQPDGYVSNNIDTNDSNALITSTELTLEDNYTIYPNPTSGIVTLNWKNELKRSVIIYDNLGNEMTKIATTSKAVTLNMENYVSGIYILKIYTKNHTLISRISKY